MPAELPRVRSHRTTWDETRPQVANDGGDAGVLVAVAVNEGNIVKAVGQRVGEDADMEMRGRQGGLHLGQRRIGKIPNTVEVVVAPFGNPFEGIEQVQLPVLRVQDAGGTAAVDADLNKAPRRGGTSDGGEGLDDIGWNDRGYHFGIAEKYPSWV